MVKDNIAAFDPTEFPQPLLERGAVRPDQMDRHPPDAPDAIHLSGLLCLDGEGRDHEREG